MQVHTKLEDQNFLIDSEELKLILKFNFSEINAEN